MVLPFARFSSACAVRSSIFLMRAPFSLLGPEHMLLARATPVKCLANSQVSAQSHNILRSALSYVPLDRLIRCADQFRRASANRLLIVRQPNCAFAEFGGVFRGLLRLVHRLYLPRILPTGKHKGGSIRQTATVVSCHPFQTTRPMLVRLYPPICAARRAKVSVRAKDSRVWMAGSK